MKPEFLISLLTLALCAYTLIKLFRSKTISSEGNCAKSGCTSKSDSRCVGKNCTKHCASYEGCFRRCLEVWKTSESEKNQMSGAAYNFGTHDFLQVKFVSSANKPSSILLICKKCGLKVNEENDFIKASHLCDEEKAHKVLEA